MVLRSNRAEGILVFRPLPDQGDYFLYYLPFRTEGSKNYPQVHYLPPETTADPAWIRRNKLHGLTPESPLFLELPAAQVLAFESRSPFHVFTAMEQAASRQETEALIASHPKAPFLLFPESRRHPIRMIHYLPHRWVKRGPTSSFEGNARPGEFYTFQIGLFACREALEEVEVSGSLLRASSGSPLSSEPIRCFQTQGVDWQGRPFHRTIQVLPGRIQALWFGVQIPAGTQAGLYQGKVMVAPKGLPPTAVQIRLQVQGPPIEEGGDQEPWRHSRLRWLDSRIGATGDPVHPFTPVQLDERSRRIEILGRRILLGPDGLPAQIQSFFNPSVTSVRPQGEDPTPILASPLRLEAQGRSIPGGRTSWTARTFRFTKFTKSTVEWESLWEEEKTNLAATLRGKCEFDGYLAISILLAASRPISLENVELQMALPAATARYMMGLGFKGGKRPRGFSWKWDPAKNQDALWVGRADAGIQVSWRDEHYLRPLNTNFYHLKPLVMPRSWCNGGKGGVQAGEDSHGNFLVRAFSGPLTLRPGGPLHFDFTLLVTPFKPLDTRAHFTRRYYHSYAPPAKIAATGANVVNIHHATPVNPYINYPFLRLKKLKAYIEEAHRLGLKVKIYDTVRELSNHAPEIFALRSLGTEIFAPGPGGGPSWLQEHLGENYIAGWCVPRYDDAAVINNGVSRWHNYYLEGLDYLARKTSIDGLYIDDIAFDRTIMQRARRILEHRRGECLIDLHSANQYNPRDGFASSANLYMEHFPYLDRLWFGEYFDYDAPPDYWLVEIAGIPFGLMGEMLQGGGNPWRGMLFGMTARLPWAGDPRSIWKLWDHFGIARSTMIGWWDPECPVKTNDERILATVYKKKDKCLVVLASWAGEPVQVRLRMNWKALGLDPRKTRLNAPAIPKLQEPRTYRPDDPIPIPPRQGQILSFSAG